MTKLEYLTSELFISLDDNQGLPWEGISHFDIFTPRYFESYIYLINDTSFYRLSNNNLIYISELPGSYSDNVLLTGGQQDYESGWLGSLGGGIVTYFASFIIDNVPIN